MRIVLLQKTKRLRATSAISLNMNEENLTLHKVSGSTTCQTNFLQGQFLQHFVQDKVDHVMVRDILPPEVFAPSTAAPQILCDIELNMERNRESTVHVVLESVVIEGTEQLHNLPLSFLTKRSVPYFYSNEINSRSVLWPEDEGEISTLCEQEKVQNFLRSNQDDRFELFPSFLFIDQGLLSCRLHFRNQNKAWVSLPFWVQKEAPRLNKQMRLGLPGRRHVSMAEYPIVTWELRNPGPTDIYLKWQNQKSPLHITPAYRYGNKPLAAFQEFAFQGQWQISGPTLHRSEKPNSWIYRLSPGEVATITLESEGLLKCPMGTLDGRMTEVPPNKPCAAHHSNLLHGYRYTIENFPTLWINQFATDSEETWQSLALNPSQYYQVESVYEFWVANKDVQRWCPGQIQINNPQVGEAFAHINSGIQGFLSCKRF